MIHLAALRAALDCHREDGTCQYCHQEKARTELGLVEAVIRAAERVIEARNPSGVAGVWIDPLADALVALRACGRHTP